MCYLYLWNIELELVKHFPDLLVGHGEVNRSGGIVPIELNSTFGKGKECKVRDIIVPKNHLGSLH